MFQIKNQFLEEQELLEKLKKRDESAYGILLDSYQTKVFNRCLSFVPNAEDAEDLAQDVFIEVFNSIDKFKGNSKISTWIYRISVNKCLEFIRKKKTKKRLGFKHSLSSSEMSIDRKNYFTEFNHPGIQLEQKEKSEILFAAINKLPEAQRVVFTLSNIDGMSYKEISEVTEKSVSSIESLLFRARNNLKKNLTEFYRKEGW